MLILFTLAVTATVVYFHWREGIFNAACLCIAVFLSGLFAFNFFEPLATWMESFLDRTGLQGYEDFMCLIMLFFTALGLLRAATNAINNTEVEYQPVVNQIGAGVIAVVTGYLLSGFLIASMETLPWSQNFLGFEPYQEQESKLRSFLPPDRVWLALMHRAGATSLSAGDASTTFDPDGAFEGNYLRNRRFSE
jgi:hypothetical protein